VQHEKKEFQRAKKHSRGEKTHQRKKTVVKRVSCYKINHMSFKVEFRRQKGMREHNRE
jgi:hypothetical protein